ncbi:MAG: hypothetical protein AAF481_16850 [Acidobacteriota bacterium]
MTLDEAIFDPPEDKEDERAEENPEEGGEGGEKQAQPLADTEPHRSGGRRR